MVENTTDISGLVPRSDDLGELFEQFGLNRWNGRHVIRPEINDQSMGSCHARAKHCGADPTICGISTGDAQERASDLWVVALTQRQVPPESGPADRRRTREITTFFEQSWRTVQPLCGKLNRLGSNLWHGVRQCNDDLFVPQGLQAFERPESIDPSLGPGGFEPGE